MSISPSGHKSGRRGSRTCLVPRIRRLPCRPVPGPISSKVGRIRTHSAGFGERLLSQEHNLTGGKSGSRTHKASRLTCFRDRHHRQLVRLSEIKSVQRDLNPRIHHGKVAGFQVTSWTRAVPAAGIEPAPSRLQRDARPSSCAGMKQSQACCR
jgi:hypothetical protein